jgi:hypothetical protein
MTQPVVLPPGVPLLPPAPAPPDVQSQLASILNDLANAAAASNTIVSPAGASPISGSEVAAMIQAAAGKLGALAPQLSPTTQVNSLASQLAACNNALIVAKSGHPVTAPGAAPVAASGTAPSSMSPSEAGALGFAIGAVLTGVGTAIVMRRKR